MNHEPKLASERLRAIIVDDEIDAIENLKELLETELNEDIEITGVAVNTRGAEQLIVAHQPDVLFLDIEMPQENAFAFLDRIRSYTFNIIFITAYDQYAIRALKLSAIDYILKPVIPEELIEAVNRLKKRSVAPSGSISKNVTTTQYGNLSEQLSNRSPIRNIILKDQHNAVVVALAQVVYLEAKASYTKFFYLDETGRERSILVSRQLSEYETALDNTAFFRVHKSFIINTSQIVSICRKEFQVSMKSGSVLPIGRRRFSAFLLFIKHMSVSYN